jgi:glycosyltransferase involved in cell wall biosynthesis
MHKCLPYYRSGYRRAAAVLAGFSHTSDDLPRAVQDRVFHFSDVGFDPEVFRPPAERRPEGPVGVLFAGRLVPGKCVDVLVQAFAGSPLLRRHRLLIAGAGPEQGRLANLIREDDLTATVSMLGWVPLPELAQRMREVEIFAFPSVRELGGGAVPEAMASGLVCVVPDHGGPGHYIAPGCCVKIPLGTRADLVDSYRRELEELVRDPDHRRQLGADARRHVSARYSWPAKARQVLGVYEWVTGRRARKPPLVLADSDG